MRLQRRLENVGVLLSIAPGTRQQRQQALLGGLLLMASVNYLDLVGVLRLGLHESAVRWAAFSWVMLSFVLMDGETLLKEVTQSLRRLMLALLLGALLLLLAFLRHPDAGDHYVAYATTLGQLSMGLKPVVNAALIAAATVWVGLRFAEWFREYRYLRRTTPEERVLEDV